MSSHMDFEGQVRAISVYGSPVLREVSAELPEDFQGLHQLVADMFVTMRHAEGVGLAAPQVGVPFRLFVIDASPFAEEIPALRDYRRVVINPTILSFSEQQEPFEEGCLSVPGIHERVYRPEGIAVRYQNEDFEWVEEELHGVPARIFQHEFDHLEGNVFVDHINPLRKRVLQARLRKMSKGQFSASYACRLG